MSQVTFSSLPFTVQQLPYNGKRIFIKFYNKCIQLGMSKLAAYRIAWSAVRKKYYRSDDRWLPFTDANEYDTTSSESDDSSASNDMHGFV
ncbi:chaB [Sucra jujuba nucleopolyhedrovirus]|uniref:ChaB n=1 Tax=Sucra jujuba nucleopolyhedrovirus TaxID=1563660 RepID=A0A097P8Y0_9ABAC|nr:chaB [Sucra jujuba nucleopolyhedrovirus]AIU41285.1 chaB [Sucra jujuba nucleopolyhedrovirus]